MTNRGGYSNTKQAFTLLELSIVLTIIALLAGGVIVGRSLVRNSELRSVMTQFSHIQSAVAAFKEQYSALPGDMTTAQSYWGVAHATPATCVITASTTTATCNGDGDGNISYAAAGSNETFRFWQHLANAGFLTGQYDGITHGSNAYSATAANSPAGKIKNTLWFVTNYGISSGSSLFDGAYGNSLVFGLAQTDDTPIGLVLKPDEAWTIDNKMDDGSPAIGKVRARTSSLSSCTSTSSSSNLSATYLVTSAALGCALIFPQVF